MKTLTESVHDNYNLQKCSICDFNCSQKGNLKVHVGLVHENKKSYMCSICDYFCSQKCDLKTHAESVHDKYVYGTEEFDLSFWLLSKR